MKFTLDDIIKDGKVYGTNDESFEPFFIELKEPILKSRPKVYMDDYYGRRGWLYEIEIYDDDVFVGCMRYFNDLNKNQWLKIFKHNINAKIQYLHVL